MQNCIYDDIYYKLLRMAHIFLQVQYFKEYLCFEMHFLREQFILNLWLLISVATTLYFHGCWIAWLLSYIFYQIFHHK